MDILRTPKPLRRAFMGTPDFAVPALEALYAAGHTIVAVYSQPPRPKGRGQKVVSSPVQAFAERHSIPVFTPASVKSPEEADRFAALNLDVAVVAAYGLILPKAILDAPRYGCLNIHASLLPRWRGAAPIQYAIWKGDAQSGVSIMQMEQVLDTGPVIMEKAVAIHSHTTASSLHDELSALGAAMIDETLRRLAADGCLESEPQDDSLSTYAKMLKKEDGIVDWSQTSSEIDRQVRALNPWPGVWAEIGGARVKILEARIAEGVSGHSPAGTLLDRKGHIVCGDLAIGGKVPVKTCLQLIKVQPENGKPMDVAGALNGGYLRL